MQSQFFSQRGILGARTGVPEGSEGQVNIQYIRTKGGAPKHQQHSQTKLMRCFPELGNFQQQVLFIHSTYVKYSVQFRFWHYINMPFQSILPPKTPSLQLSPQTKLTYKKYSKQYTQIQLLISKKKQPPTETNYYLDSKLCIWSATPLQLASTSQCCQGGNLGES